MTLFFHIILVVTIFLIFILLLTLWLLFFLLLIQDLFLSQNFSLLTAVPEVIHVQKNQKFIAIKLVHLPYHPRYLELQNNYLKLSIEELGKTYVLHIIFCLLWSQTQNHTTISLCIYINQTKVVEMKQISQDGKTTAKR